jgi:hypothetical protein
VKTSGPAELLLPCFSYRRCHYSRMRLPPLATLPDELLGRYLALVQFGQDNIGPEDAITPGVSDLLDAFDVSRLIGVFPPLGPEYV